MAEWISVKERLPKHGGWYLVCVCRWVTLAWWAGKWEDFATCNAISNQVTHWMELPNAPVTPPPEPPKEEME